MNKTNLLYVVYGFHQAGAERFTYELDKALDKTKFNLTILCLQSKNQKNDVWKESYYIDKHQELGTKIIFFDRYKPSRLIINRAIRKTKRIITNTESKDFKSNLIPFLNKFDLIHWMGEYTYLHHLPKKIQEKSLICVMSAKFQNPKIYQKFNHNLRYNLTSGFSEQECKFEFSEFKTYKHWYIPLLMNLSHQTKIWKYKNSPIKKIGIFTRLDRYKPLDPFFYAFHILLNDIADCELHIFGNGDPVKEGLDRYLNNLGIREKVFFRGHQDNVVTTLTNEHIDLSWFQGYNNNRPAGYAGFDVCSTGTPLICWDFLEKPINPCNEVYPHYKNLLHFVKKSVEILTNEIEATNLSEKQFNDILQNRDINRNFYLIEKAYSDILNSI